VSPRLGLELYGEPISGIDTAVKRSIVRSESAANIAAPRSHRIGSCSKDRRIPCGGCQILEQTSKTFQGPIAPARNLRQRAEAGPDCLSLRSRVRLPTIGEAGFAASNGSSVSQPCQFRIQADGHGFHGPSGEDRQAKASVGAPGNRSCPKSPVRGITPAPSNAPVLDGIPHPPVDIERPTSCLRGNQ